MKRSGTSPEDDEHTQLKSENIDLKGKVKMLEGIKNERDKLLNENSALKQQ
ncbi:hypothetical protein [Blattabacterium cuenoti]|uniref:hypothetical protein n=1 Tax=Blattabacterium cuenoti TaxID=1653831 RepID=UPI00311F8658